MYVVLLDANARDDLAQAISTYDQAREGLGGEFLEEVRTQLTRIAENPRLYPIFHRGAHKATMTRFPYEVVYFVSKQEVCVAAIWHAKRDPRKLIKRMKNPN